MRKPKASPADAPLRHFEVKMIGVEGVVVRPKHGGEKPAGALMHLREKTALRRLLAPVLQHGNAPPVAKIEACNVDGVAARMAAAAGILFVVHIPAGIGAVMADARDL